MTLKKILLMGNPNVGKSALFSRLTGAKVMISNYPGCTVEFSQGEMKVDGERPVVIDVPGTYSLAPTCKAEEVAVKMLGEGDVVINVVDATNLERNLCLTLQLLDSGKPVIVALNMWDDTKHRGIYIDTKKLEELLGVPVVPTSGLSGTGVKELIQRIHEAKAQQTRHTQDEIWEKIGKITANVQKLTHRHHTLLDRLEDWSVYPFSRWIIAAAVVIGSFWFIRFAGEGMISLVFDPLFEGVWLPLMEKLSIFLGANSVLHQILIGTLENGSIDFGNSLGLLTTGLYVPIAMVFPYVFSFYFLLGLLEDLGYLPRLAVLADNFMHRLGLHGYAVIPFMLGLGCNVPGALALRILEERREKFIAATLMAVSVPCMAQTAVIIGLVGQRGMTYLLLVFLILFTIMMIEGVILNAAVKGESPEILLEIPPYRMPRFGTTVKKLWMRMSAFFTEALPIVFLGIFIVNLLHSLKVLDVLGLIFRPVITGLWGLPAEMVPALLVGLLRKDVAVGMLGGLGLDNGQLVTGAVILAIYFPCLATFFVLYREMGKADMLKITLIMIATVTAVGTLLNMLF
ncbi:MAG: ferrous iron transporter B [Endomicrobiales bacterium]|nr:ferrous iron transporter B [Endomicrobiales bacterium]